MARRTSPESRIKALERRLEQNPSSAAFFPLASLLWRRGEAERAESLLRGGLAVYPDYPAAGVLLAEILLAGDAREEASGLLEKALAATPWNIRGQRLLARCHQERGDAAAARAATRIADMFAVDEMAARARAADADEKPGDAPADGDAVLQEDAPAELDMQKGGGHPDPAPVATPTLAELYMSQGHPDKAADVYARLLESDPENEAWRRRLAAAREEMARAAAPDAPTGYTGMEETLELIAGEVAPPDAAAPPAGTSAEDALGAHPEADESAAAALPDESLGLDDSPAPPDADVPAAGRGEAASEESARPPLEGVGEVDSVSPGGDEAPAAGDAAPPDADAPSASLGDGPDIESGPETGEAEPAREGLEAASPAGTSAEDALGAHPEADESAAEALPDESLGVEDSPAPPDAVAPGASLGDGPERESGPETGEAEPAREGLEAASPLDGAEPALAEAADAPAPSITPEHRAEALAGGQGVVEAPAARDAAPPAGTSAEDVVGAHPEADEAAAEALPDESLGVGDSPAPPDAVAPGASLGDGPERESSPKTGEAEPAREGLEVASPADGAEETPEPAPAEAADAPAPSITPEHRVEALAGGQGVVEAPAARDAAPPGGTSAEDVVGAHPEADESAAEALPDESLSAEDSPAPPDADAPSASLEDVPDIESSPETGEAEPAREGLEAASPADGAEETPEPAPAEAADAPAPSITPEHRVEALPSGQGVVEAPAAGDAAPPAGTSAEDALGAHPEADEAAAALPDESLGVGDSPAPPDADVPAAGRGEAALDKLARSPLEGVGEVDSVSPGGDEAPAAGDAASLGDRPDIESGPETGEAEPAREGLEAASPPDGAEETPEPAPAGAADAPAPSITPEHRVEALPSGQGVVEAPAAGDAAFLGDRPDIESGPETGEAEPAREGLEAGAHPAEGGVDSILVRMMELYIEEGNGAQALDMCRKARTLGRDYPRVLERISEVERELSESASSLLPRAPEAAADESLPALAVAEQRVVQTLEGWLETLRRRKANA